MDDFELRRVIYGHIKEICHYSQMQVFATSFYQKNYFQLQIDEAINGLINFYSENQGVREENQLYSVQQQGEQQGEQQEQVEPSQEQEQNETMRTFTAEELAYYDGGEGRPAYVAVNGNVYDVSMVLRWAGGTHFGLHAGQDLSGEFMGCHLGITERLDSLPKIGVLLEGDN
jgi:predicted heme/steroid binding protein